MPSKLARREKVLAQDKKHLKWLIQAEIIDYGPNSDLNFIDTSLIEDMNGLFYQSEFNGNISGWDVSGVLRMAGMFLGSQFNGDISGWKTKKVLDMHSMFRNSQFNGDVSTLDVSNVVNMAFMFENSRFCGDLSTWKISKVKYMDEMFSGSLFSGDISPWNISHVTSANNPNFCKGMSLMDYHQYWSQRNQLMKKAAKLTGEQKISKIGRPVHKKNQVL